MPVEERKQSSSTSKKEKVGNVIHGPTLFSDQDIYLYKEGNHFQLYNKLGSHMAIFGLFKKRRRMDS